MRSRVAKNHIRLSNQSLATVEAIETRVLLAASLVSVNAAGTTAVGGSPAADNGDLLDASFSPDGRYLLFRSTAANLASGITDNNGVEDLFIRDLQTNTTSIVSANRNGTAVGNDTLRAVKFSPGSDFLLYVSAEANLVTGVSDTNGTADIFLRNLATGTTTMLTAKTDNTAGGYVFRSATELVFSPDGKYLAFEAFTDGLVAGVTDTNGVADFFLRDLQAGTTSVVSIAAGGGSTGNASSELPTPAFSRDGKRMLFRSSASDLVTGITDSNNTSDIFLRDFDTNTTTLVTTNAAGNAAANGGSLSPLFGGPDALSVVFGSVATDLVSGVSDAGGIDLFRKDLQTGVTTLLSVNSAGAAAGGVSRPFVSPNGRYVKFVSTASDIVAGTTDSGGSLDLFVRDLQTNDTIPVSFDTAGNSLGLVAFSSVPTRNFPTEVLFSPDDKYALVVSSASGLVPGTNDANGADDLFLMDMSTRELSLLTGNTAGVATGLPDASSAPFNEFSPDGRYVMFVTGGAGIVDGVVDANATLDVFVRDLQTGTTIAVNATPANDSIGDKGSQFPLFTPDSTRVLFGSNATNLVAGVADLNEMPDVYSRDLTTNTTILVSNNPEGVGPGTGGIANALSPFFLSKDGTKIAVGSTANNLVTRLPDTNNASDVFVIPSTGPAGVDDGGGGGTGTVDFTLVDAAVTNVKPGNFVGGAKGGVARTSVQNVGADLFKGTLAVTFFASADATLDGADTAISPTVNKKVSLKPNGKAAKVSLKFLYPNVAAGTYFILARVDSADAVPESNETNNTAASAISIGIAPPFVDLSGASLAGRGKLTAGKRGAATLAVLNSGNVIAKALPNVQLFASIDNVLGGGDDVPLLDGPVKISIKPGATKNVTLRADLTNLPSGTYNLIAVIDSTNVVTESVEDNNTTLSATTVTVL